MSYKVFQIIPDVPSKVVTEGKNLEKRLEETLATIPERNRPFRLLLKQSSVE